MDSLLTFVRTFHIAFAFAGLAAFWVPALARKGGPSHVRFGKVFAFCTYCVAGSAVLMAVLHSIDLALSGVELRSEPEAYGLMLFLVYLAIVTLASVRQAIRVVDTSDDHARLRTPFHRALAAGSIVGSLSVIVFALVFWSSLSVLFLLLSPIGFGVGSGILRYMRRPPAHPRAWFFEHMGSMLGAGIAYHTAFAVFGVGRLFGLDPEGTWGIVPWILPAAIGVPASVIWDRYYRRKFVLPGTRETAETEAG